jgi:hypothetical protein
METKDALKRALIQEAEAGVRKLLEHLQKLPEGDLKGLEQGVMEPIFEIGRGWIQSVLSESEAAPEEQVPGERVGSCRHQQQLVGSRPKQVLTLLGKITFKRAYYQCVLAAEGVQASSQRRGCRRARSTAARMEKPLLISSGESRGGRPRPESSKLSAICAPPRRWKKPQPPSVACFPSRGQHAQR